MKLSIRQICIILLFMGISLPMSADSIPVPRNDNGDKTKVKNLSEIIVKSDLRREIPNGFAYFPTKTEKRFASNAYSLLEIMSIPELMIVPGTNKIETITNAEVSYFIDGIRASDQDLKGLFPKDVDKVEFLTTPADAKFAGAENVVNFVTKKYVTGGYTKTSADQNFNSFKGEYSLNSKLTHKKITYDALVEGGFTNDNKIGTEENQRLNGISYNGIDYESVNILSKGINGKSRDRFVNALLKTTLIKDMFNFYITAGSRWNFRPLVEKKIASAYRPSIIESDFYTSNTKQHSINPYLQSSVNFDIGNNQNVNVYLSAQNAVYDTESTYSPDKLPPIFNRSHDKQESYFAQFSYSKKINRKNALYLETWGAWNSGKVRYQGSSSSNTLTYSSNLALMAKFSHTFSPGTNISAEIGYEQQREKIDNYRSSPGYMRYDVRFSKKWNKKSYMRASSRIYNVGYPSSMKNDVIIQSSELFWKKGNINLRSRMIWDNSISNVWNFSNKFSQTCSASVQTWFNRDLNVWEHINGYDGLVNYLIDNNQTHRVIINSTSTLRLFERKFIISANIKYRYFKTIGEYNINYGNMTGYCVATWYGKNWHVGASIVPQRKELDNITKIYYPTSFDLKAGFIIGELIISAYVHNPFKNNHISSRTWINTPNYNKYQINSNGYASQSFRITATYTIGYGKKVERNDPMMGGGLQSGAMEF